MFFTRFYERRLAQASYMVGCQATGEALVIDPNRDIAQYVAAARAERLRITYVTETHIHADFVSGALELARHAKASLLLSGEGGKDWSYAHGSDPDVRVLRDGDTLSVGRLRFDVMHTPGHTPEHLAFILTDVPASPHPVMVFTGDFVFVGDVGRPDLLERAAGQADTMHDSARQLWKSLGRFRQLPDHLQIQPGHGAGSACGKALGAVPSSTIGYEKLVNWAFAAPDEDTFVRAVLEGQAEPPAYFARMKRVNKAGAPFIGLMEAPALLDAPRVHSLSNDGALLVDLRPADAFAAGHAHGAISVPLTRSFTTYAGSVIPADATVVLVTDAEGVAPAADAARELRLIGIDAIAGHVPVSVFEASEGAERVASRDAVSRHASGIPVFDVRNSVEWSEGHIPGTTHIPFPSVVSRMNDFPRDPFLVMCQTGARSAIAASVLRRAGLPAIDAGGIVQWQRAGGAVSAGHE